MKKSLLGLFAVTALASHVANALELKAWVIDGDTEPKSPSTSSWRRVSMPSTRIRT